MSDALFQFNRLALILWLTYSNSNEHENKYGYTPSNTENLESIYKNQQIINKYSHEKEERKGGKKCPHSVDFFFKKKKAY